MESSSSRMVLRSSWRLLGCCVLLLAAVMLVGFMATSGTPIAGISSQSALKFGFRLVLLLFCHFRHISFSFYGPIVSQYHKMRVFSSNRWFERQRNGGRMFEWFSLCVNDVSQLEVKNEWDSQWIVLRCVWDRLYIEESTYLPTEWILKMKLPWSDTLTIQIRNGQLHSCLSPMKDL